MNSLFSYMRVGLINFCPIGGSAFVASWFKRNKN